MGWIYRWTHIESGMSYIGKTTDFNQRIRDHASGNGNSPHLCHAIKKYGVDVFEVDILCEVPDELLVALEICYIKVLGTLHPRGYNLTEGGEGGKPSDETRRKISEAHTGKKRPPFSQQWRDRMSESRKGKTQSLETIQKRVEANKEYRHSLETRRRISESHIGKKASPESLRKKSEAMKVYWAKRKFVTFMFALQLYMEELVTPEWRS